MMRTAAPHLPATQPPTQEPSTLDLYAAKYSGIAREARRALASAKGLEEDAVVLTPAIVVDYLIAKKAHYASNSWRLIRAAVVWSLDELANRAQEPAFTKQIETAIARLRFEPPAPDIDKAPKTSATKDNGLAPRDRERIQHRALSTQAPSAGALVLYLNVGVLAGLRPSEWAHAELRPSLRPGFRWELVVVNAKSTNGRGNGIARTLYWHDLPDSMVKDIAAWIEIARNPGYDKLLATIGDLLARITRELWPRRTRWPTLYSTRHEATARWKAYFLKDGQTEEERRTALATIAALLGHGSDETASKHYARARARTMPAETDDFPTPSADPEQIATVRKVMDLQWREKLAAKKQRKP